MIKLIRSLAENRALLRNFVARDLKARYVGSSLGFFWSVVYPIMNLAVYMVVFQIILKASWPLKSSQEVVLHMLVAIVAWSAVAESISRSTNVLIENQNLIEKVVFPSEILPAYITISAMINMIIALPIVLCALAWAMFLPSADSVALAAQTGQAGVQLGWNLAWLPLLLVLQAVFVVGIGYFLSTFNLFWRDTFHVIGVALTVWMFITPIFYAPSMMTKAGYGWLLTINPMHWLMDMYRSVLVTDTAPDPVYLVGFAIAGVVSLSVGAAFFRSQRARFPDLF